jgi:hypothetical protein
MRSNVKTENNNRLSVYLITVISIAAALSGLISACDGITDSNDPMPLYTLDIYPLYDTREIEIEKNLGIGGLLINSKRDSLRGYLVNFYLSPDTLAIITPTAHLEPDSSNGFREEVTFYGNQEGVVLITGIVNNADGSILAQDTLYIKVRDPVNG